MRCPGRCCWVLGFLDWRTSAHARCRATAHGTTNGESGGLFSSEKRRRLGARGGKMATQLPEPCYEASKYGCRAAAASSALCGCPACCHCLCCYSNHSTSTSLTTQCSAMRPYTISMHGYFQLTPAICRSHILPIGPFYLSITIILSQRPLLTYTTLKPNPSTLLTPHFLCFNLALSCLVFRIIAHCAPGLSHFLFHLAHRTWSEQLFTFLSVSSGASSPCWTTLMYRTKLL